MSPTMCPTVQTQRQAQARRLNTSPADVVAVVAVVAVVVAAAAAVYLDLLVAVATTVGSWQYSWEKMSRRPLGPQMDDWPDLSGQLAFVAAAVGLVADEEGQS